MMNNALHSTKDWYNENDKVSKVGMSQVTSHYIYALGPKWPKVLIYANWALTQMSPN